MVTSKKPSPVEPGPEESGPLEADTVPYPVVDPRGAADTEPLAPSGERSVPTMPASTASPSFVRRHPLAVGITAAALAVVVVSGLTAWGVGAAVASSYETGASVAAAPAASAPPLAAGKGPAAARSVVRGTIDGIEGSTWTITTRSSGKHRVTVDSATLYGTKKAPASASDFAVGSAVLIVEKSKGTGRIAVRVVEAKAGTAKAGSAKAGTTAPVAPAPAAPATPGT